MSNQAVRYARYAPLGLQVHERRSGDLIWDVWSPDFPGMVASAMSLSMAHDCFVKQLDVLYELGEAEESEPYVDQITCLLLGFHRYKESVGTAKDPVPLT